MTKCNYTDPILEGKRTNKNKNCYTEHYWVNWQNQNMVKNFINVQFIEITVLWLWNKYTRVKECNVGYLISQVAAGGAVVDIGASKNREKKKGGETGNSPELGL